jgi:D-apionolactonase
LNSITLTFDVDLPELKPLSTGNLTCLYENGNLRYIKLGEIEVIRMIYSAVRDRDWKTIPYTVSDEKIEKRPDGFTITYKALYCLGEINYEASIEIVGEENKISFSMKGQSRSWFESNRIGLCVHHPLKECLGKIVSLTSSADTCYQTQFPTLISPHQPFKKIRKMEWGPTEGVLAKLGFEGEVFETEDQRNWTDSSFKTYSRPLELPFPFPIEQGETMQQKITLEVQGLLKPTTGETTTTGTHKIPFPRLGSCRPVGSPHLSDKELALLAKTGLDHYRVELDMANGWEDEFLNGASEAERLGIGLELVVFFDSNFSGQLENLLQHSAFVTSNILSVLILSSTQKTTEPQLMDTAFKEIKKRFPELSVGYGTDAYFTELNRNRPEGLNFDFLSFSINPQVHATDTRSLIENLESQKDVLNSAKVLAAGRDVHVSPLTFKRRYNPDATSGDGRKQNGETDLRQETAFGVSWTLASIENLAQAQRITLFKTLGPNGLIQEGKLSPFADMLIKIREFDPLFIIRSANSTVDATFTVENKVGEHLQIVSKGFYSALTQNEVTI